MINVVVIVGTEYFSLKKVTYVENNILVLLELSTDMLAGHYSE